MPTADEIVVKLSAQTAQFNAAMAESAAYMSAMTDDISGTFANAAGAVSASSTAMQQQIDALTHISAPIDWQNDILNAEGLRSGTAHIKAQYAGMFDSIAEQERNALATTMAWTANFKQQIDEAADTARYKRIAHEAVESAQAQRAALDAERAASVANASETVAASGSVRAANDALGVSLTSSTRSFRDFENIQKEGLRTAEQVAAAQATINAVQQTGALTSEELAAKQALVDAAMLKMGKDTQAAAFGLDMFTRNSRTMYSTSALLTDAMTGQFSRMRREVAALGNETGLMARAFRLVASPAGVATLAVAGLGVAFVEAADHFERFQQTILSTGDIIGMTAGQLQEMSDSIGTTTGSSFAAVEAVNALGRSGLFTGQQLRTAAEGAVFFSQATGENMNKAASAIEQLQDKPKEAIVKVNDQYHFLTQSQVDLIVQLLKTGQSAQAAAVAVQAFHDAMADRAQQMVDNTSALSRDWQAVKEWTQGSVEALAEYLNMLGGSKDTTDQLNRAYIQLANDQSILFRLGHPFSSQADAIKRDMAAIDALRDKESQQESQAQQTAAANKAAAESLDKGVGGVKGGSGVSALEQQFQEQEAKAHASYDQMKQDAADFWNEQATDAKNSAAVQAQAWQKYIEARHQLDAQGLAADNAATRKREENARKAAEAAKRAAQGRARAEQQASDEIQAEAKKEAAAVHASDMAKITGARQVGLARIDAARQQAQTEFDSGNISAGELLQVEQQLVQSKLAEEMRYYQRKLTLDQGDVAAQQADMSAITAAKLKADQAMSANTDKFIKDDERKWKSYGQRIAGAFQNATNSMLFQGQTLRQGLASVAESIFETFVEAVVNKPLQAFIAGEGEKLAAAIGFGSQKTAEEETQRAINAAADSADKAAAAARAAGLAGAQGVASFAAAPWPIDMGAPAFGAAMFAEATAFGAVASAAGGWDRVPADGVQTILHKDEMVLPKHVADPVRNMAKSGGSGASNHFHINAMDARSFRDFLKRNPSAVSAALGHAGRNGWT